MGKKFFIRTSYANVVTTLGLIYLKPFPAITTSELLIVLLWWSTVWNWCWDCC